MPRDLSFIHVLQLVLSPLWLASLRWPVFKRLFDFKIGARGALERPVCTAQAGSAWGGVEGCVQAARVARRSAWGYRA